MIKNILKKEKGSITLFVLISVIFFLAIAFTAYASSINKSQSQDLEFAKIKSNYENSYTDSQIKELHKDTVVDDKIPPTKPSIEIVSGSLGNNNWYISDIVIKIISGTDNESGIKNTTYELSGNTTIGQTTIESGNTFIIKNDGNTTITAYSYDNAGNQSEATVLTIKKDSIKPMVKNVTATTNSITLEAIDEESEIIGYQTTTTTEIPTEFISCKNTNSLNITLDGKIQDTKYYVWVKDEAGNISESKAVSTIIVPELNTTNVTFSYSPNTWTNGSVVATATTTLEGYTIQTSTDAINWQNTNTLTYETNGKIYARLIDNSNQSGQYATGNITNIDKTAPTAPTITIITKSPFNNGWYNTDVEVQITAGTDNESGVQKVVYVLRGSTVQRIETEIESGSTITISNQNKIGSSGTYEPTKIFAYTYDNVGNKSEQVISDINIDKTPPTITLTQLNTTSKEYTKQIEAEVTDSISQVNIKKYAYRNQKTSYFSKNGNNLGDTFTAQTSDNEPYKTTPVYIYTIYAKDNAGNEAIQTITVQNLLIYNTITGKNGMRVTENGQIDSSTGKITIPKSTTMYGPYWTLPSGTYDIYYIGHNLTVTGVEKDVYCIDTETSYPITVRQNSATRVVNRITIPSSNNEKRLECRLMNSSATTVDIERIIIKQIN